LKYAGVPLFDRHFEVAANALRDNGFGAAFPPKSWCIATGFAGHGPPLVMHLHFRRAHVAAATPRT
jgi:hypothetical protein